MEVLGLESVGSAVAAGRTWVGGGNEGNENNCRQGTGLCNRWTAIIL